MSESVCSLCEVLIVKAGDVCGRPAFILGSALVITDFYCVQVGLNYLFAVFFLLCVLIVSFVFSSSACIIFFCSLVFVVSAGGRSVETMGTTNCLLSALEYVC